MVKPDGGDADYASRMSVANRDLVNLQGLYNSLKLEFMNQVSLCDDLNGEVATLRA